MIRLTGSRPCRLITSSRSSNLSKTVSGSCQLPYGLVACQQALKARIAPQRIPARVEPQALDAYPGGRRELPIQHRQGSVVVANACEHLGCIPHAAKTCPGIFRLRQDLAHTLRLGERL